MKLFICEKPSQAKDLAPHVGARERGNGAITGQGVTVTWCIGHLLEQAKPEHYEPRLVSWDINLLPVLPQQWALKVKDEVKAQFHVVEKLLKQASEVVIATDADREGEVIAREVMQLVGYRGPVKRLWLSAMDPASIKKALGKLIDGPKTVSLYQSGLGRGRADWLGGMNLTMALTKAFGTGGKEGTLHFGRVQTPVLALIVRRERAIRNFVPKTHYGLKAAFDLAGVNVPMGWMPLAEILDKDGHVSDKAAGEAAVARARRQLGTVTNVVTTPERELAPLLYSLGTLQRDASARYGLKAQAVLDACQSLYETHKATTYPRTDCEYLPESMFGDAPAVLDALVAIDPTLRTLTAAAAFSKPGRAFNDKRITAHHAIIPTLNPRVTLADLNKTERLVYDLIRRRYLAQFLGDFQFLKTVIDVDCRGEMFRVTGKAPQVVGWRVVLQDAGSVSSKKASDNAGSEENDEAPIDLPQVKTGASAQNLLCELDTRKTQAPKRYNEGTLLAAMDSIDKEIDDERLKKIMRTKEKAGIGTDATRSVTIENLFHRAYIGNDTKKKKDIVPLPKGEALVDLLERVAPQLVDPALTAEWEDKLMQIEAGTYRLEAFEAELSEWIKTLTQRIRDQAGTQRLPSSGPTIACPACSAPMRRIKGPKGFFWGCSAYAQGCKSTLPDVDGQPGQPRTPAERERSPNPQNGPTELSYPCPQCHKPLRARSGAKGPFWGCTGYPNCTYTAPDDGGKPGSRVQDVAGRATPSERQRTIAAAASAAAPAAQVGDLCPACHAGSLVQRFAKEKGRHFLGCSKFPACRHFQWLAK